MKRSIDILVSTAKLLCVCLLIFGNQPQSADAALKRPALVIADSLRVRSTPSMRGTEITQLPRGTMVYIIEKSTEIDRIDDLTAPWYKINYGTIVGWCFGGFLTMNFQESPDKNIKTWNMDTKGDHSIVKTAIYITNQKKLNIITYEAMSTGSAFSKSFKYLAVDNGTDVVGSITFYDCLTGKSIASASYTRHSLVWKGERLTFKAVTYIGDGCLLWREDTFDDGAIIKGSTAGKGPYHMMGGKKDPKCN